MQTAVLFLFGVQTILLASARSQVTPDSVTVDIDVAILDSNYKNCGSEFCAISYAETVAYLQVTWTTNSRIVNPTLDLYRDNLQKVGLHVCYSSRKWVLSMSACFRSARVPAGKHVMIMAISPLPLPGQSSDFTVVVPGYASASSEKQDSVTLEVGPEHHSPPDAKM